MVIAAGVIVVMLAYPAGLPAHSAGALRRDRRRHPVASHLAGLHTRGVATVGSLPRALPHFGLPGPAFA